MKHLFILLIGILIINISKAQDTLNIFECFEAIEENYPKVAERELIEKQKKLKIDNIQAEWYPSVDLNMQATYQSDRVKVDLGDQLPFSVDMPSASKDQYKATLDINQMVYDGGATQSSRKVEKLGSEIQNQSVDVDLHQIKDRLMEVYFGILLLQKQEGILQATLEELDKKTQSVEAGVNNGVLLPSDLQSLKAEKIKLEQSLDEINRKISANMAVINELTGLSIDVGMMLNLPEIELNRELEYSRPENELFHLQKQQLEASKSRVKSQKSPKVFAFGQLGYGKPGLNMLQDEFDSFYIVGAKLSWNLWDWNKNKRQRNQLEVQKQIVEVRQETFNKSITVSLEQISSDIDNYNRALERDKRIIELRKQVIGSAKSKLENGVITSSDYIADLNKLKKARITHEKHKVELIKSKFEYLLTAGKIEKQ
jgi:outer membrane protein TolC